MKNVGYNIKTELTKKMDVLYENISKHYKSNEMSDAIISILIKTDSLDNLLLFKIREEFNK